jgi:hypothetical protein
METQVSAVEEKRRDAERRREPRVPYRAVHVMAFGQGENLVFEPAEVVDCSLHGVAILLNRALAKGLHFFVKLKIDGRVTLVDYVVRNCRRQGRHGNRIGGEYCGVIGAVDEVGADRVMQALLAD